MLNQIKPDQVIFIDIETVPAFPDFKSVPENFKILWEKKISNTFKEEEIPEDRNYNRAGIYAEFGKIACIIAGVLHQDGKELHLKSFCGFNEKEFLKDFAQMLNALKADKLLCAHNGKEFDFPFLARRMLINRIPLPKILDTAGRKPWEVNHLDTMDLWKFGDYKSYTSINLLAAVFDIPTPKDDIDGSDVHRVFWQENDLERIVNYCRKDVVTLARLFQCFKNQKTVKDENVVLV